jgi:hypothetical protein
MSDTIIDELIEEIIGKVASLYKVSLTLVASPSSLLASTDSERAKWDECRCPRRSRCSTWW